MLLEKIEELINEIGLAGIKQTAKRVGIVGGAVGGAVAANSLYNRYNQAGAVRTAAADAAKSTANRKLLAIGATGIAAGAGGAALLRRRQ